MKPTWSLLHRICFRFLFLFFILWASPWGRVPYLSGWFWKYYYYPSFWIQQYLLNGNDTMAWTHGETGSGDTYDDWVLTAFYLSISIIGCIIWSIIAHQKKEYNKLDYWFRVFIRYYLASILFSYGFQKIFPVQMNFPDLVQLNTTLGDLSPMRLAWLFIGYSTPYEFFCGLMEILSGLLLIFRRTQLLGGLFASITVFNVVMLNFCYDIPVKLFSSQLFLMSFYLLFHERKRLISFFFQNQITPEPEYGPEFNKPPGKYIRLGAFIVFVGYFFVYDFYGTYQYWQKQKNHPPFDLFGAYAVKNQTINQVEVNNSSDSLRWNFIVMANSNASDQGYGFIKTGMNTTEPTYYTITDSSELYIYFSENRSLDFRGTYKVNESELLINGISGLDTLSLSLIKIEKPFKLETKPFQWIAAYPY